MLQTIDEIDELDSFSFDTEDVSIAGTSRKGTLTASRKEIERQFGAPDNGYPKTTYHWQIRFPGGDVATIYDYYGSNQMAGPEEEVEWSVGGTGYDVLDMLGYLGFDVE